MGVFPDFRADEELNMKIERIDPDAHLDELVNLARVEYGDSEIANLDYLRWQYLENPAGKAIVVVARSDVGELAGQYVVIPLQFRIGGERVKGSLSLNTLTHPAYRGQGLFTKMANETYAICEQEGLAITLGFPNKNSYPGFVRKLQFRHIGNASVMFKPLSPMRLLAGLPKTRGASKYGASAIDDNHLDQLFPKVGSFEISELDFHEHASDYDTLIDQQTAPRFSVGKHAEFCHWRFQAIPTRRYRAFQARDGNGIQASCITRQRKVKGIDCAFVVELHLADDANGFAAARQLLKAVLKQYRKAGSALAGLMVNPGSNAHRVARSVWFREMPSRLLPHDAPIIVRRNGQSASESIFQVKDWAFFFGDYDVF